MTNKQTKMVELSSLGDANLPSLNEQNKNLLRCFIICKIMSQFTSRNHKAFSGRKQDLISNQNKNLKFQTEIEFFSIMKI